MPWYTYVLILVGMILLMRLIQWFAFGKLFAKEQKPLKIDPALIPVAQDISEELQTAGTSGVVPSGVSWIQTSHAGGVAVGPRRLGFQRGRKKGRKNAIRRRSRNFG